MSYSNQLLRRILLKSVPRHCAEKSRIHVQNQYSFTGFELVLLGTGAGMPSIQRGATSVCMQLHGKNWLIDCGEGSLRQIFRSTVRVTSTEKIFITHVHGDHIFGLPGMICTLNALNAGYVDPVSKQVIRRPIDIYGPQGIFDFVHNSLRVSCASLGNIQLTIHELLESNSGKSVDVSTSNHEGIRRKYIYPDIVDNIPRWNVFHDAEHTVVAGALKHTVPSFGYVIEEAPKLGRLNVDEVQRRGLPPGPMYQRLKKGEVVQLPDGTALYPHEVTGPVRRGRKAAILGDSADSSGMFRIAQDVDVLVHEATLARNMGPTAHERGHSTSGMAGHAAYKMNAKLLVLSHISGRFSLSRGSLRSVQQLVDEARISFRRRAVIDGCDLMRIPIPSPKD